MNKKKFGILGIIIVAILFIISSLITSDNRKNKTNKLSDDINVILENADEESKEASNNPTEQKEFTEINVDTYLELYKNEEKKIILIARPTCQYCQIAEPILHKIAYEYDLEINYLNTDNFTEEDSDNLFNSNERFNEGFGTPMLLIISNENINDEVDGLTDYAHYINFFTDNKLIK